MTLAHELWFVVGGLLLPALRSSTPILLAILGETLTQRVGVVNLGVEGQMLVGAVAGFALASHGVNPWLALAFGACVGMLLSSLHALMVLVFDANQLASGIAILILGSSLAAFYGIPYVGQKIDGFGAFPQSLLDIPVLGGWLGDLSPTVLLALVLSPLIGLWLYRTRTGLAFLAVGESRTTAMACGITPWRIQLAGVLAGGFLSGLAGAALSVDYTRNWVEGITAGRGLVAVGLVIVARWNPYLALPAALLFGAAEALYLRLQAVGVPVSSYLLATLPYAVSLLVLLWSYRAARGRGGMPEELKRVLAK
jgi:simple sugar transport system permease protein